MDLPEACVETANLYALVTYLPEPLGSFLNCLRAELVPGCHLRAHITVLPPRQLASEPLAWEQLRRESHEFAPVTLELGGVEVFPVTSVIYLSVRSGGDQLHRMHERLAIRALAFDEPFEYHPHITLAQGLTAAEVVERKELARRRWQEYRGPRGFTLGSMTFVRSADRVDWRDLGEVVLPNGRVL